GGGLGMFPVAIDGFLLVAAALLLALRPERRLVALVVCLGLLTLASGALGTTVGLVKALHYLAKVPTERVLEIAFMAAAQALHCLVLALFAVAVALGMGAIAAFRASRGQLAA
ncbi:MAG TPA: hypothetical protein PLU22_25070, partial [Polyangiaceae bacterium]|nr:hypothetical protein [Polyangiaceae bacterium]